MKTINFSEIGEFRHVNKPVPGIEKQDQLLIKIEVASICGSDVHILHDPPAIPAKIGVTLGHEFVGEVVEVGSAVENFTPGDRLVCDPNIPCGNCYYCRSGNPNMCINVETLGVDLDGGFAEYCLVPEKASVKISKDLSPEMAIFAEPLTCVVNALNKVRILPGETVLIMGGGPIGAYFASLLKANGAGKVFVAEISDYRIKFLETLDVATIINPQKDNLSEIIKNATMGIGTDLVVDAVGTLLPDCLKNVRRAGKVLLFGQNSAVNQTIYQNDITRNGLTIYGSFIGNFTLPATVALLENGLVDFTKMITHKISLEQFGEGLQSMRKGEAVKVVIYPGGTV